MLTASQALALSILSSYFLCILLLFYIIFSSIRRHAKRTAGRPPPAAAAFGALAVGALAHTWFWMFRFMAWSFRAYEDGDGDGAAALGRDSATTLERVASWLRDTALFEQAWRAVCAAPLNWWWSEQLCLFTAGAFTVFLYMHRDRVPHAWAYMLLGQLVAVSVAWSLFNLALALLPPPTHRGPLPQRLLPPSLTVPVLLSMLTISLSPHTSAATFLPNLLAMHALLLLPLLLPPLPAASHRGIAPALAPRATAFCTLLALLAALLRARTTRAVLAALGISSSPFFLSPAYPADAALALWRAPAAVCARAWGALHAHPAQASIGWDVVWTSVACLAWGVAQPERRRGRGPWRVVAEVAQTALQAAVASVGVVAPLEIARALREEEDLRPSSEHIKDE